MALWFRPFRFGGVYNTGSDKHARRQYRRTKPACQRPKQSKCSPKCYDPDNMCLTSKLRTFGLQNGRRLWTNVVTKRTCSFGASDRFPVRDPLSLFREAKLAWPRELCFTTLRTGLRTRVVVARRLRVRTFTAKPASPQGPKDRTKASLQDLRTTKGQS
jgi:hypothetical protein